MTYSYDFRTKRADAEDYRRLRVFEKIVDHLKTKESKVMNSGPYGVAEASVAVKVAFEGVKKFGAAPLFLEILRQYKMAPKDRKVMETAAKTFAKGSVRVQRSKAIETYVKMLKAYTLFLEVAQRVVAKGTLHTDSDTTLTAGPFTLINTGGFDAKQMEVAQKVVIQAAKALQSKGLGKVCYGDIQITNSIDNSTRTLAFYLIGKDEMYVRANLKGKQGPAVTSVIHELGHRLHYKYLKSKDAELKEIYRSIKNQENAQLKEYLQDKSQHPKPGETIKEGRTTYVVTGLGYNRRTYEPTVELENEKDPNRKASLPLKAWFQNKGHAMAFVSNYASTTYEENFAEMIAFYCEGLLPDDQVAMLKGLGL